MKLQCAHFKSHKRGRSFLTFFAIVCFILAVSPAAKAALNINSLPVSMGESVAIGATATQTLTVENTAGTTLNFEIRIARFYDNMEGGTNGWTAGLWVQDNADAYSTATSWFFNSGNPSALISPEIDLTDLTSIELRFFENYNLVSFQDFAPVDVTTDGGSNWTALRGSTLSFTAPTGNSSGWTDVIDPTLVQDFLSLEAFAGQTIQVRFSLETTVVVSSTWRVDDVSVTAAVPGFSLDTGSGQIVGAGTQDITVTFDATGLGAGSYEVDLVITSDDLSNPVVSVPVTLTVTSGNVPDLQVDSTTLNFGSFPTDDPTGETQNLTVSNDGAVNLNVSNINLTDGDGGVSSASFTVVPTTFSVTPGNNQNVSVTFIPSAAGSRNATLAFVSDDDPPTPTVSLSGTGLTPDPNIQVDPTSLNFFKAGPPAAPGAFATDFISPTKVNFDPSADYVPGQVLVKFRSGSLQGYPTISGGAIVTSSESLNGLFRELQVTAMTKVFRSTVEPLGNIYKLEVSTPQQMGAVLHRLATDSAVEWVEPDYLARTSVVPNDTDFLAEQWALTQIQAEGGWDLQQGNENIVIAVVDTGVDYNHVDLAANMWNNPGEINGNTIDDDGNGFVDDFYGHDFVDDPDGDGSDGDGPMDVDLSSVGGHGTHVAGVSSAVGNNGVGIAGTTWNCKIMAIRGLTRDAGGANSNPSSNIAAGIEYAANNGANVINMSFNVAFLAALDAAFSTADSLGVVLVGAAGNDGADTQKYPASDSRVIAVAASDDNDARPFFSNYGSWVDVAAPGGGNSAAISIYSTKKSNLYGGERGTSQAAPFVSGLAALLLSQNPTLTPSQVKDAILSNLQYHNVLEARFYRTWRQI